MAAPTFIQEAETAWNTGTSPKTTPSFNALANDVLVAFSIVGDTHASCAISDNTSGALTWTLKQDITTASFTRVQIWSTTVPADRTGITVTFTRSAFTDFFGGNVLTWRGSTGVSASAQATNASGAPSLALTTTGANSAIVTVNGDWNAGTGARTWRTVNGITPTAANGDEVSYFSDGSNYGVYGAYYPDAGAAGSKTVGLSAPTGQKYAIAALEVLGGSGGTDGSVTSPVEAGVGDIPTPTVAADAPVTAPVAGGTGDIPAPTVSGSGDGSAVAPPLDGTGDLTTPTLEADSTVTSPAAAGTGDLVTPAQALSAEVDPGPMSGTGDIPAPAVGGTGDSTTTAPPLDGTGDIPTPTVSAGSSETAPPLDGTGDVVTPGVSAGSTETAPPLDGTGDIPTPSVSGSSAATVTAPVMDGTGDMGAAIGHGPSLRAGEVSTGAVEPTYSTGAVEVALTGTGGARAGVASTSATEPTPSTGAVEVTGDRGALEVVF